jgi:hypothetical protein
MIIKSLSELQEPDAASLVFSQLATGGFSAADAALWQQEAVARYAVSAQVRRPPPAPAATGRRHPEVPGDFPVTGPVLDQLCRR